MVKAEVGRAEEAAMAGNSEDGVMEMGLEAAEVAEEVAVEIVVKVSREADPIKVVARVVAAVTVDEVGILPHVALESWARPMVCLPRTT